MMKAKRLKKGDIIAIVSPSSSIKNFPKRLERGIKFLESKGYVIKIMPKALDTQGYNASDAESRANDINQAFADKNISMILCSTGGLTANGILPFLDFDLIKKNPKIFCGYSDITTLNLVITSKTELITFNGPTLLSNLADFEGSVGFTFDFFEQICSGEYNLSKKLPQSTKYSFESLFWDRDDNRDLKMKKAPEVISFGPKGNFSGRLFGGNLQTFHDLTCESDSFNLENTILFLEEEGLSSDWYERFFENMKRKLVFKKIKALIFARPTKDFLEAENNERTLETLLNEISKEYNLPILANIDCGHTKPLLTFPLGIKVEVDTKKKEIYFKEQAVE